MPSFCGELDGGEPHAGAEPPTAATALPAAGRWGEGMNHHEWDFHRYGTRKRPSGSPARRWVVQQSLPRLLCDTAARAPSLPAPAAAWLVLLSGQPRPHRVRCGRSGGRARGRGCRPAESPAGPAAGGARPSPAPGAAPSGRRRLPAGGDKHPRRHRPGTPPPPPPPSAGGPGVWGAPCPSRQRLATESLPPPASHTPHRRRRRSRGEAQSPRCLGRSCGEEIWGTGGGEKSWWVPLRCPPPPPLAGRGRRGVADTGALPPGRPAAQGDDGDPERPPPPRPPAAEGRDGGGRKGRGRREGESREAEQEGAARESGGERGSTSASGGGRAAPAARGCALGRGGGDGRARGGSASRRPPRLGRLPPRYIGEGGVAEGGVPGVAKAHGAAMPPARGAHK